MPGTQRNCLPLAGNSIPDVDIEAPIRTAKSPVCQYYSHDYAHAAKQVETSNAAVAKLYQTLSILCSFFPNYQDASEPYRPAAIYDGKRSSVPGDLSESDLD